MWESTYDPVYAAPWGKKHSKKKRSVNLIPGVGCSLCMDSIMSTSQAEENPIHANVICTVCCVFACPIRECCRVCLGNTARARWAWSEDRPDRTDCDTADRERESNTLRDRERVTSHTCARRIRTNFLMWSHCRNMRWWPKVFLIILQANDPFQKKKKRALPGPLGTSNMITDGLSRLEKTCSQSSKSHRFLPPLNDGAIKCFIVCQRQCYHCSGFQLSCSFSSKSCHAKHREMRCKPISYFSLFCFLLFA